MKRFYTIFVLSLLAQAAIFTSNSFSQSYAPLIVGDTAFYTGFSPESSRDAVRGARIDSSLNVNGNIIYYLNKTWNLSDYHCIRPNGNSWLGPCFTKSQDGAYHFFNKYGQSLELRTQANVNEKWTMIDFGIAGYVEARVEKVVWEDFIGLSDSVKYISINAVLNPPFDQKFENINNHSIAAVSRNYGFVSVINFNEFSDSLGFEDESFYILNLSGKTNPAAGKTFISDADIYNFDLGDEFHYSSYSNDIPYSKTESWAIETVKEKYFSPQRDSVSYIFKVKARFLYNDFTNNTKRDTINNYEEKRSYSLKRRSLLPYEPNISEGDFPFYSIEIDESVNNRRAFLPSIEMYHPPFGNDTCWHYVFVDGAGPSTYMEGIGLFYQSWGMNIGDEGENKLVYYKKGSETWGTPLNITSVEEADNHDFSICPNPATNMIFVNSPSNEKICLYTPEGINLIESSPNVQIDISALAPGIYFLSQGSRIVKFIKF